MARVTKVGMTDPAFYKGRDIVCNVCDAHFEIEEGDDIKVDLDKSTNTYFASLACPSCGEVTAIHRMVD
jgi:hypothetical protein